MRDCSHLPEGLRVTLLLVQVLCVGLCLIKGLLQLGRDGLVWTEGSCSGSLVQVMNVAQELLRDPLVVCSRQNVNQR